MDHTVFALFSVVIGLVYIGFLIIVWNSTNIGIQAAKALFTLVLVLLAIMSVNIFAIVTWGLALLFNLFVLAVRYNKYLSDQTSKDVQELPEETDFVCAHCGTSSETKKGNCQKCGAPLSEK